MFVIHTPAYVPAVHPTIIPASKYKDFIIINNSDSDKLSQLRERSGYNVLTRGVWDFAHALWASNPAWWHEHPLQFVRLVADVHGVQAPTESRLKEIKRVLDHLRDVHPHTMPGSHSPYIPMTSCELELG